MTEVGKANVYNLHDFEKKMNFNFHKELYFFKIQTVLWHRFKKKKKATKKTTSCIPVFTRLSGDTDLFPYWTITVIVGLFAAEK